MYAKSVTRLIKQKHWSQQEKGKYMKELLEAQNNLDQILAETDWFDKYEIIIRVDKK